MTKTRADRTAEKKAAFLDALETSGNVTGACETVKLPRRTAYDWKAADPEFSDAWETALSLGVDALEDEATKRAFGGSDTLLIFLLKARRPERFKDRAVHEHTGKDGGPIETVSVSPREELNSRLSRLIDGSAADGTAGRVH